MWMKDQSVFKQRKKISRCFSTFFFFFLISPSGLYNMTGFLNYSEFSSQSKGLYIEKEIYIFFSCGLGDINSPGQNSLSRHELYLH